MTVDMVNDCVIDFEKFQDIFTRVREEDLINFKNKALEKIRVV